MAERVLTVTEPAPGGTLRDALVRSRLWIAAEAFFFLSWVFAYVYLRVLNVNGKWRPPHTKPPAALGAITFAVIVVSAILSAMALRRLRAGAPSAWRSLSVLALAMGLASVGLAGWQLTHLSFSASDSAYGSVFVGWMAVYALNVFGAMYWLETLVAQAFRYPSEAGLARAMVVEDGEGDRRSPDGGADGGDGERGPGTPAHPLGWLGMGAEQFTGFWYFMAAVGVLTYVLLYLA